MRSSGRLAGEATTDAATNAVATVATLRSMPPARRSIRRACITAQISAMREVTAASASENGNRPAKSRSSIRGNAISMIVSAAQYASLIVVMRPTSSASVFWRGRGSGSAAGDWSTMSRRSRMPFAQREDAMNMQGILIGSEDPKRLRDYYTKLFGDPTFDDNGYFGWRLGDGTVAFGPHDQVKGKNREPGRVIWNLESSDVKGEFQKLKTAGATVV